MKYGEGAIKEAGPTHARHSAPNDEHVRGLGSTANCRTDLEDGEEG